MDSQQQAYTIMLAVLATPDEIAQVSDRLAAALCADEVHAGPCPNPWQLMTVPYDDLEGPARAAWAHMVDDLLEQRRHEFE